MKPAQLKKLSTEELIEKYRDLSAKHGQLFEAGKPGKANKVFDTVAAIRDELKARGAEAEQPLRALLHDPEPGTRYWAALLALDFAPTEAEPVLVQLASVPQSLIGLSASLALEKWRHGTVGSIAVADREPLPHPKDD